MQGKCIGFFGPTGSGKTTQLNKIAREHGCVSYCFQDNCLIENQSVLKNVVLPLENIFARDEAVQVAEKWIRLLDLQDKRDVLCGKLSGGEKQRVGIARAFAYDAEIFLLDEPCSAQDKEHKEIIFQLIIQLKEQGKLIYLVSHEKTFLEGLCDQIQEFPQTKTE